MSNECMELQNIKYQTMLLNGNSKVTSAKVDSLNIDDFLERERNANKNKPWSKLGKNQKIQKIQEYIQQFIKKHNCSIEEIESLKVYLIKCLERKKLQRVKDVVYDTNNGMIKSIPGLIFDKTKRKFTLKKMDRNKSSLRSLAPKNKNKTVKTKLKAKIKRKKNTKIKESDKTK